MSNTDKKILVLGNSGLTAALILLDRGRFQTKQEDTKTKQSKRKTEND